MKINHDEIKCKLCRNLEDKKVNDLETIHRRSNGRGGLLRLGLLNGTTVAVKVWYVRDLREWFKATINLSNGQREWRMHRLIFQAGINVPEPLGFYSLITKKGLRFQTMVIEDIGETIKSMIYLKQLISANDELLVLEFEEKLIESTAQLLKLHILDIDHQMNNFVIDQKGCLMRIDFECARRYPFRYMPQKQYIKMLARFITGYIYTVQPDVGRSIRFAERLYEVLGVSRKEKILIQKAVTGNLSSQLATKGIETVVRLPV
jgi:hypothetical protein